MSRFFIARFVYQERIPLFFDVVNPESLPIGVLAPENIARLDESLSVDSNDDMACAASARFLEDLLDSHRIPFLMLRVADMRMTFDRMSTAVPLYEELATILNDDEFTDWVSAVREASDEISREDLRLYNTDKQKFTASQRWKPTATDDVFPYFRLPKSRVEATRTRWKALGKVETTMERYLNMNCLETNEIEGTFKFNASATTKLIQVGFYNEVAPTLPGPFEGEVRDVVSALSILKDTRNALDVLFKMIQAIQAGKGFVLTPADILKLHREVMRTSFVLCLTRPSGKHLSYISPGITRQASRINVTAKRDSVKVQFCPFDCVDKELEAFCTRFNLIINMDASDMDPFSAAAWISHVFVTIHPFEDGNGRVSRLLASIPLLLNNLPPLNIPPQTKTNYIDHLNHVRANRPDASVYDGLVEFLCSAVNASLATLQTISQGTQGV